MSCAEVLTTGYRLTDGRYFIVMDEGGKIAAIKQIQFGCSIHPAPVKEVPEKNWPDVLALVRRHE